MKFNLQEMRKRAGYKSARAFAERIGMSLNTYNNYEQGVTKLTLEKAWEFADVLECSLDELAGRKWPPDDLASIDPRRRTLIESYDALTDDGKTLASELVASVARDPLRRAAAAEARSAGPAPKAHGKELTA